MKKSLFLVGLMLGITMLFAGCASVPQDVNLTGKWLYEYGPDLGKKGSMTLSQDGYDVTGTSNNMDGQYQITGKITGTTFSYEGKSENNNFTAVCQLTSANAFEGSYTSTAGTSGQIQARRLK